MAAVASAPSSALDADATTLSRLTASVPAPADASASSADNAHPPPRLLLRLPPQTEIDGRRNPLKRKWRSIVNFFALPIRAYYLEPPGAAYRAELRARRGDFSDQGDGQPTFWPVPAYTDQVGDDEMVLFKAQEEAEALAAMQRDQQANAAAAEAHAQQQQASLDFNDAFTTDNEDDRSEQDEEELASPAMWPQPSPGANTVPAFPSLLAEPSPRYELTDPLVDTSLPSQPIPTPPARRVRTRTTSNLSPVAEPSFANGVAMSRHLSTPLSPTAPASPPTTSGVFARRNRAQTNAPRPSLAGRNISEPLSWTLVRSHYSYPKRGLTAEQLTFLSSVESLGRFGVPHSPSGAPVQPSPAYESCANANDYGFPITAAPSHA